MIFRRISFIILLAGIIIINNRCAQIGPLSGGAKDLTPPKLLSVTPKDTSTNVPVKNATFIFQFDEMIDIKTVTSSMVINPVTDLPEVRASGKKMILSFDIDDLQPNTTYQIQFGKSIGDVHENNKYKNLTYIFSTGPTIDTNTLSGKASWALSSRPARDVSVMLFSNLNDTAITRTKPNYLVKTDSAGKYTLSAIKPGTYQIVAVTDKNKNNAYDGGEGLGFINQPLTITGKDTASFIMSTPKSNKTFVKKKLQPFWGYNKYILNDTVPDAYILLVEDSSKNDTRNSDNDKLAYETRKDTLEVYYKDIYDTELKFLLKRDQVIFDTITLEVPKEAKVDSTVSKHSKKIRVTPNKRTYGIANDDVLFDFSLPVTAIDLEKCFLLHDDSLSEKPLFTSENKNETNNLVTTYLPSYRKRLLNKLLESKNYKLMFLPNSLTNYWGKLNADTCITTFKTFSSEDVGTLKITLTLPDSTHYYVVQLLSNGSLIAEYSAAAKKQNIISFYNLPAAEYSLRLIDDADANKKFTPGIFSTHTQPEAIYLYNKSIKIPAGWDIETDWNILHPEKK